METYYPESQSDDAFWERSASDGIVYPGSTFYFGYTGSVYLDAFVRFKLPISQGLPLASAAISFVNDEAQTDLVSVTLHAVLDDNASAPETILAANALPLTDGILWEIPQWDEGVRYSSPDISSIIQEIINRPGWVSGNSIVIMMKGDSGRSAIRKAVTYDSEEPDKYPGLSVELYGSSLIFPSFFVDASAIVAHTTGRADIAFPRFSCVGKTNLVANGSLEFPALAVAAHVGGRAAVTIPKPSVVATARSILSAAGVCLAPSLVVSAHAGAQGACVLSLFVEGLAGARADVRLPVPLVAASGTSTPLVVGAMVMPQPRVNASALTGIVASGDCLLPQPWCRGTVSVPLSAWATLFLPRPSVDGVASVDSLGSADLIMPHFILHAQARGLPAWAGRTLQFDPERLA